MRSKEGLHLTDSRERETNFLIATVQRRIFPVGYEFPSSKQRANSTFPVTDMIRGIISSIFNLKNKGTNTRQLHKKFSMRYDLFST
uniref:Putative ovule protein n=1 Tax=Solanum chacoense TaxID=4108 RepID=A0A0V0HX47_SOLCH